jgi:hypothetical protein
MDSNPGAMSDYTDWELCRIIQSLSHFKPEFHVNNKLLVYTSPRMYSFWITGSELWMLVGEIVAAYSQNQLNHRAGSVSNGDELRSKFCLDSD